jgi:ABC-type Fe3+-citrate transport system substrate-binding protein
VISKLKHSDGEYYNDLNSLNYNTAPAGWKSMFMGLLSPFSNKYQRNLSSSVIEQINNIVKASKKEAEMNLKPKETVERMSNFKKKVKKSYRRRSSMRMSIEENIHTENSQREDYIEALRYLQNISEQKQISLLN